MFLEQALAMPDLPAGRDRVIDIADVCATRGYALLTSWVCLSVCPARARHRLTDRYGHTETNTPRQMDRDRQTDRDRLTETD